MSKPRDERQKDLFRPGLEQIIDMDFDQRHIRKAFFDQWIPTFHEIALDGVQWMRSNCRPSDQELALSFVS